MSSKDFKLPDLGEGVHEGQVLRVMVSPGDTVREGDPVASVFARDEPGAAGGLAALGEAIAIGEEGRLSPLITHRITARGVEVRAGAR